MWQHVVNNKDLKGLAMLSLFLLIGMIERFLACVQLFQKRMDLIVFLRWGSIYSIMNITVFGGVLWI